MIACPRFADPMFAAGKIRGRRRRSTRVGDRPKYANYIVTPDKIINGGGRATPRRPVQ